VAAGGGAFDGLAKIGTGAAPDFAWNGNWTNAVVLSTNAWTAEILIPKATLRAAGLDPASLAMNALARNISDVGERDSVLTYPGVQGWKFCDRFLSLCEQPPKVEARPCTVRLHFAEPEALKPGERMFHVSLDGRRVLTGLDPVKEAGAPFRAFVREFKEVPVASALRVELRNANGSSGKPPLLCGLEIVETN
jgi:hypothetical protein